MKRNNRGSKSAKPAASPSVQRVCGRSLIAILPSGNSSTVIPIQPSTFPRILAMGDVFEFYRFVSLKVELPPDNFLGGGTATEYAVGYSNQTFDTAPTLVSQVIELPCASRQVQAASVFRSFVVSRNELINNAPLKWYKTIVGTPDQLFETQGNLYCVANANSTATINLVVDWEVEFSQWNLAAQSPFPALEQIPGTDLFRKISTKPSLDVKLSTA